MVALGVGVMFTLTVYLVQSALVRQIRGSTPRGMANVFLLDIPGPERDKVVETVRAQAGIESPPEVMAAVSARITAVDGTPASDNRNSEKAMATAGCLRPTPARSS